MSTDATDRRTHRAWVEIDAAALRRNLGRIRAAVGADTPVIPMVKADAYGVGARGVVDALERAEPYAWGVATVAEGEALRAHGVTRPVGVYSPLAPSDVPGAVEAGLTVTLSDLDGLTALRAAARDLGRPATFQVEVDTGMGRAGFLPGDVAGWGPAMTDAHGSDGLEWVGIFTHFHSADEPGAPDVRRQLEAFQQVVARLQLPPSCLAHVANSAAALLLGSAVGAARPGVFLYGGGVGLDLPAPEPVATVRARVVRVREAGPGESTGYGATYRAEGPERWATLAIGYADGLPRALGGRGRALIAGKAVPLIGRISMDMTVANISGLDGVEPGDIATLIGRDGDTHVTVDEVARLSGTISYEVLTGLAPRLPRIWMDDGAG